MARDYHVDIARHAADADSKWVDNLLSHFDIPGVAGGRQGVARRVTAHGVYQVVLIRRLTLLFGMKTAKAVSMAGQLLHDGEQSSLDSDYGIELRLDRRVFERAIDGAITEAVESVTPARRGRPRTRA
jgi:hypothetical protein